MVCYNELGCFRDEGPFNYLDLLPAPPEEINTRFFLYTPRNRDLPHPLVYNNASTILTSPYNASLPTKVMIHGFGSSCQRIWAKEMRTALISVVSWPNRSIWLKINQLITLDFQIFIVFFLPLFVYRIRETSMSFVSIGKTEPIFPITSERRLTPVWWVGK